MDPATHALAGLSTGSGGSMASSRPSRSVDDALRT